MGFYETAGKYRYGAGAEVTTKDYDSNDMGINFQTNYYSISGEGSYRILNPTKIFNSFNTNMNFRSQFQKETGKLQSNNFNININSDNKRNDYIGLGFNINPFETYDYYEPSIANRYIINPNRYGAWFYFSSNYANKFAIDFNPKVAVLGESGRNSYGVTIGPRYRIDDHVSFYYEFNFFRQNNNKGFADSFKKNKALPADNIIFANRNIITYSNIFGGKYALNSKMNFDLSVRQYWSFAENKNFYNLQQNGRLTENLSYTENKNSNFNSWNLDLSYNWWFAPGSQIVVLYRNNASISNNLINKDFEQNVSNMLTNDTLSHVLSISIKYFIDYNQVKNIF